MSGVACRQGHEYNAVYENECLNRVAFPLGGIGAGMMCLEGTGKLSHVSLRHQPEIYNEPLMFSALCIKGKEDGTRVLEGPVARWKTFFPWAPTSQGSSGNGGGGRDYGLPRFSRASFSARFPFATVMLEDTVLPVSVQIVGWSPFIPGDADNSSLPVAALEYRFINTSKKAVDAIYSFHAHNFLATESGGASVGSVPKGFALGQLGTNDKPWEQGSFAAFVESHEVRINHAWFRGAWFDPLSILWKEVEEAAMPQRPPISEGAPSMGGSLFVPFVIGPGEEKVIYLLFAWYIPMSNLSFGQGADDQELRKECRSGECASGRIVYRPWYAARFPDINAVADYWRGNYEALRRETEAFTECFYDTTLPDEVLEAVAANLSILKSPTILRQQDGRLWCWEGCCDSSGSCGGSCTHVWNYAQALPYLFPELERTLRQTEFNECQDQQGHQEFRAPLPIRPAVHQVLAAADGQLGGIMKVYRDWRISGDSQWLRELWPKVKQSLDYCIEVWDPERNGVLVEPHHNTYDIEFWGADSMCTSIYLGALQAFITMGQALNEDISSYQNLLEKGCSFLEQELFNGEYFFQKIQWEGLRAGDPSEMGLHSKNTYSSPEAIELLRREGPKYQYGMGCLSDGIIGAWIAAICGVGEFLEREKVKSHLLSVFKYNFYQDLSLHANTQRPTYALGKEGGLLLCSWPRGGKPSLPFVFSNEVWTGIEYQVASHLMMMGCVDEGLTIVRTCRDRYDGRVRNPFNEYECGHWYARAMSSYALLQALSGARYDALEKVLYMKPNIKGDFRSFLSTASGYGTVGVKDGKPFVNTRRGKIEVTSIDYAPCSS